MLTTSMPGAAVRPLALRPHRTGREWTVAPTQLVDDLLGRLSLTRECFAWNRLIVGAGEPVRVAPDTDALPGGIAEIETRDVDEYLRWIGVGADALHQYRSRSDADGGRFRAHVVVASEVVLDRGGELCIAGLPAIVLFDRLCCRGGRLSLSTPATVAVGHLLGHRNEEPS